MALLIKPITLKQANEIIEKWHRHHKPVVGHRFSIAAFDFETKKIKGIAVVGRPVARKVDQYDVAEVTRLVTDGAKNACSFLYSACARICKEMGFYKIQTYILESEPGTSLIASGWQFKSIAGGGDWNCNARKNRRTDQPQIKKKRYEKILNKENNF